MLVLNSSLRIANCSFRHQFVSSVPSVSKQSSRSIIKSLPLYHDLYTARSFSKASQPLISHFHDIRRSKLMPRLSKSYATSSSSAKSSSTGSTPRPKFKAIVSKKAAPKRNEKGEIVLSTGQKVYAATKTGVNFGIIVAGVVVFGSLIYFISTELFSSTSSSSVYNSALSKIQEDQRIIKELGEPIKGYPSLGGRRRARRVNYTIVTDENPNAKYPQRLLMRFYLEGPIATGQVGCEMVEIDEEWEYVQLFVDIPGGGMPSRRIVLEDKRKEYGTVLNVQRK
ncbi:TIM21-domain-containing protein [Paraphysoderma sedebokerense]|nr:TIM21-domain-containing protein [Paraphysoderma sedebokerense]